MNAFPVDASGNVIRYFDLSGGRPLVFLHGLGCASSFSFSGIARDPQLISHRTILIDLLGFGYSDRPSSFSYTMEAQAEIVVRLLEHLSIDSAVLIGHSMGGAIAILAAAGCPERIGRLVLAEGNLDPEPGIVSGPIAAWEEHSIETEHRQFVAQMRAAGFPGYAATVERASPLAMYRSAVDLIAPRVPTFREVLMDLSIPATYLFSEESQRDPDVARLPEGGVSVAIVPACGHDMMADNPSGFAEAVAAAIV